MLGGNLLIPNVLSACPLRIGGGGRASRVAARERVAERTAARLLDRRRLRRLRFALGLQEAHELGAGALAAGSGVE